MLTLQYIPHREIGHLGIDAKIKKILKSVKEDKIILIEGKLDPFEESQLIEKTMESIDRRFKGIEIACIVANKNKLLGDKIKKELAKLLLGRDDGLTIIGPATIVKEIKRNPNKIDLLLRK